MLEVIVIFVFDVRQSVWFVLENAIWEILHYFLETPLFCAVLFFAWKERMKERKSTSLFMHSGFSKCPLRSVAPGCYNSFLSSNKALDRKTIEQFNPIPTRLCHVIYCCGDKKLSLSSWNWVKRYFSVEFIKSPKLPSSNFIYLLLHFDFWQDIYSVLGIFAYVLHMFCFCMWKLCRTTFETMWTQRWNPI
jgi:hypothetical protein